MVLHCRDMTERHAREQALQSVAYTDPMTGLPNRAGFLQARACGWLTAAGRSRRRCSLIELDGLAAARENAGREIVSAVVAEVGRRLRATVRGEDVVARMGGGAFAVLAEGTDADADRLAARCLSVVEQPILTTAGVIDLTAGVGLVPLEEGLGVEDLLARGRPGRPGGPRRPAPAPPRRYHDGSRRRRRPAGPAAPRPRRARAPAASCSCSSSRSCRSSSSGSPASRRSCAGGTPSSARCRRRSSCRWPSAPA